MPAHRPSLFSRMSDRIDVGFVWLKWPFAVLSIVLLVPAIEACFAVLIGCVREPRPILPFVGGVGVYLLLWLWLIRWWRTTFFSTLEHELTHSLFAVLTFHKVVGLRTSWSQGGHMRFVGRGNWLITLAPYFFPTICWALMLFYWLVPVIPWEIAHALNGAAFAYHVTSTMRETHAGQSDLQRAGFLYCFAVLPTANLLCNGLVVAFAYSGPSGVVTFLQNIEIATKSLLAMFGMPHW
jgi:hypothetical protein